MTTFTSVEALKREILMRTKVGVLNTREKIYAEIERCLQKYYGEYDPVKYVRTQQLMNSLVRESFGDGLGFEVYFDPSRLNYVTGNWGADEVLNTAMHGSHGGYVDGTAIWDESMVELGDIVALIKRELIAAGLPVK